jgi:hypothetical protein
VLNRRTAPASGRGILELLTIDLSGDTVMRHELAYSPLPMSSGAVDSVFRASAAQNAGGDSSLISIIEAALRRRIRPPVSQIAVTQIVAGTDGSIWLRREDGRSASGAPSLGSIQ